MNQFPLIDLQNISKFYSSRFGSVNALQPINLKIHHGEFVSMIGPSGSGKSTLLQILGCLDRPSTGKYLFNEQDVSELNDVHLASLRASQIGFVFQSFNLISHLNIYENIEVPLLYQCPPLSEKEIHLRILEVIEQMKLSHRIHHLPAQLSGGETQRTAIARALAIQPLLILADEPTGNLDTETAHSILNILKKLNKQGVTLIIVTHDQKVGEYSERVLRMQDGCIMIDNC